eukprot:CAMPEP_0174886852 /NCGR_PEP_ID=MMETSP0167-20121228/2096_1 /TAXON_ID=38298 /ORGANISM="Rhodella maculata, Strain CCMP736" /LENGTH=60 /DNA_ID=CAMNT_0016123053 /DNA_START=17 /DNA_END=199 /DNA_ORIENTATION=-
MRSYACVTRASLRSIEPQMEVDQQEHSNKMSDSEEREGSNEESWGSGIEEDDSDTDMSEG